MTHTEKIKILAQVDNDTLKKALDECKGSEEAKKRTMKEIEEYRYMRNEIAKMFGR